jgi:SAM-dependent methyltransferase
MRAALGPAHRLAVELACQAIGPLSGRSVLCLGCGGGAELLFLSQFLEPCGRLIGVDSSPVEVNRAREKTLRRSTSNAVEVHVKDAADLRSLGTFALLYASFLTHHLDDPVAALQSWTSLATTLVTLDWEPSPAGNLDHLYRAAGWQTTGQREVPLPHEHSARQIVIRSHRSDP